MEIKRFLGLKNTVAPEKLRAGELALAYDVDVDNAGQVRTRRGLTQLAAGSYHSLYAREGLCLVMVGPDLKRMSESGGLTQLRRLSASLPVRYEEQNGVVYFTNGIDTGRVAGGSALEWGVRPPSSQPPAAAGGAGSLSPATYMYAMTYVRDDGLESGTPHAASLELTARGGIEFTDLPTSSDASVTHKRLYLSGPDGTELFLVTTLPASASTYSHRRDGTDLGWPLDADLIEAAPAGTALASHAGAMYVASGSTIWVSDRFSPERFRRQKRFLQLTGPVTMLSAVDDGLYAATDSGTWFFAGYDPQAMEPSQVLTYGAVPGTASKFDSLELVPEEQQAGVTRPAALWHSPFGVILGLSGGQVKNLTEDNYGFPAASRGAALFRTARGYSSYIMSLQAPGDAVNAY